MKTAVRISALSLFLFLAVFGHGIASVMVRREAEETTPIEKNAVDNETDVTGAEESTDTEASPGEAGIVEEKGKEADVTETEEEGKETGVTEVEDEGKTSEEGISDEEEEFFPDIGFQTGLVFGSPFVNLEQMQRYFFELERALHRVFENTLKEAALNPETNSTSSEEVTVGGHKYLVNRTVVKGGDSDSSVVIKAVTIVPTEERRKRAVLELL